MIEQLKQPKANSQTKVYVLIQPHYHGDVYHSTYGTKQEAEIIQTKLELEGAASEIIEVNIETLKDL